jgi:beta-N-acetylhexosaminidase
MANCGKHFPGHGFVAADSHIAIPVDERDPKDILKDDAAPYGWLGMSLSAVMPAHVIYPKFDKQPAGFSRKWLSLLRNDLGFDGVIFSDDLSMEGASVAGTVVDGAHAALAAGCDMVLVCNSPDKADQLLQGLDPSVSIDAQVSAQRIAALAPTSSAKDWDALQEDGHYLAAKQLLADFAQAV